MDEDNGSDDSGEDEDDAPPWTDPEEEDDDDWIDGPTLPTQRAEQLREAVGSPVRLGGAAFRL